MALTLPDPISIATPETPGPYYALHNWSAGAAPTVNDDETDGYEAGSFWVNVVFPYGFWVCTDAAATAAVWREIPIAQLQKTVTCTAGETLNAQDAVNLYNDAGTLKARKANATDNTKPCHGFVHTSYTSGAVNCVVFIESEIIRASLSGLTAATVYYLSTTGGALTSTAPSTSGNVVQRLGLALSSTSILWERGTPVDVP